MEDIWEEEMDKENITTNLFELSEKVYDDGLSKSVMTVGDAMADLLKFIALPFSFLGMTSDELLNRYKKFLEKSINKVPREKIIRPEAIILSKLFEDVKFVFSDNVLEEMFSNLLAASINKDTSANIHVSFVNIISQLDTVDAKLIKEIHDTEIFPICDIYFANNIIKEKIFSNLCYVDNIDGKKLSISIVNLLRLGLIEIVDNCELGNKLFENIKKMEEFSRINMIYDKVKIQKPEYSNFKIEIDKKKVVFTTLGEVFSNHVF